MPLIIHTNTPPPPPPPPMHKPMSTTLVSCYILCHIFPTYVKINLNHWYLRLFIGRRTLIYKTHMTLLYRDILVYLRTSQSEARWKQQITYMYVLSGTVLHLNHFMDILWQTLSYVHRDPRCSSVLCTNGTRMREGSSIRLANECYTLPYVYQLWKRSNLSLQWPSATGVQCVFDKYIYNHTSENWAFSKSYIPAVNGDNYWCFSRLCFVFKSC